MFDALVKIVVEHPVIGGSFGAFIAAIISALLQMNWLAFVFVLIGIGLAVLQIVLSNR